MRIAIITDQYPPFLGGVSDVVRFEAEGLLSLGHSVQVFAPRFPDTRPESHVVRMRSIPFARGSGNLVIPMGLAKSLRTFDPDVVHVHSVGLLAFTGLLAAKRMRVPIAATYHGSMADYLHAIHLDLMPLRRAVEKICAMYFNAANVVTAPSRHALTLLRAQGVSRPSFAYVSNPIDTALFRPFGDTTAAKRTFDIGANAVLLFGRVSREKNLDEALAIFARLPETSQLVVIGDGPYLDALKERARAMHIYERSRFLGRLTGERLVQAICACDVMLSTSFTEVQPLAILQALACGVPVVGAKAGGVPECIRDGEDGFLVEPHDIEGFRAALARVLVGGEMRASLSRSAASRAERYAPARIAKEYVRVFEGLPSADIGVRMRERAFE